MEELVAAMAHRRRREVAALAERHVVSRFGHKGRIQVPLSRFVSAGTTAENLIQEKQTIAINIIMAIAVLMNNNMMIEFQLRKNLSGYLLNSDNSGNLQCDEVMKTNGKSVPERLCKLWCSQSEIFSSIKLFKNDQIQNTENEVSAPCPLDPVSHLAAHQQESWQHSSFGSQHHDNQNFLEMEVRVRGEMSQIHHEIYELRKLVESLYCIPRLMPSQHNSTTKRASCCICQTMQVDSLLYR
ncbi:hypothetical protein PR202_gb20875 [Eleusine coracana subsp. coracana]|uniref:Uncharacterized protein n=1 Tax=Eleusine coracana subsp. coracana TaxID=191504 RepID=A0AAV5FDL9_ELECO|nr:hypothetical protein PR202_gb20875 [Eleusine coracana subsp. coracana]